jgi:hypothetical protein
MTTAVRASMRSTEALGILLGVSAMCRCRQVSYNNYTEQTPLVAKAHKQEKPLSA